MSLVNVEAVPMLTLQDVDLESVQESVRSMEGVDTCHVFASDGRNHVVVHGGRLSNIALLLDAQLGASKYDLTYTCD